MPLRVKANGSIFIFGTLIQVHAGLCRSLLCILSSDSRALKGRHVAALQIKIVRKRYPVDLKESSLHSRESPLRCFCLFCENHLAEHHL